MSGEIKISNVTKVFGTDTEQVVALGGVDFTIPAGSFVSLIGPSGCGKTTLLRCIAGLETPTSGELSVDGAAITKPGSDRGFAFQQANLFPWLTIRENVAFGLKARHIYKERKDDVDSFIKLVGLEGFESSYPHQLSGGMNQRASLARALVGHPKILLLDEPLGALDAFTRMNMQDEILKLWQRSNHIVLMVTHDIDEALYLGTRIIVMAPRPGRIREDMKNEMPYPRVRTSDEFLQMRKRVLEMLNFGQILN